MLYVRVRWTASKAGGIHAVVARHRHMETSRGGERPDFDLADSPPRRVGRKTILFTARHLAGMATNAGGHIKHEPPLRTLGQQVTRFVGGGASDEGCEDRGIG